MARRKERNKPGLRKAGELREKVQLGHSEVGRVCELGFRTRMFISTVRMVHLDCWEP